MRRTFAFLLALMLVLPFVNLSLGDETTQTAEETYVQDYTFHIKLDENGDANITLTTVWSEPKDKIHEMIEKLLNQTNGSIENATRFYESQQLQAYTQALKQSGLQIENGSVKVYGLGEGNNVTVIFSGRAKGVAKYYSHGNFWEVLVDPTRGYSHVASPDTAYPYRVVLRNTFIVELPPNATLLSYPLGYKRTYNQSSFEVTPEVKGNTVIIRSTLNLEPYLNTEGFNWLFGDYKGFSITYQTPYEGQETYSKSVLREGITVEVLKNGTAILTMRDEYVEPVNQILAMKIQILQYGRKNVEQQLLGYYTRMFKQMGAEVEGAGISLKNLNTTDPLVIEARFILENYTKLVNGTYSLKIDPTMGLMNSVYLRSSAEFNYTFSALIKLPEGWKFTEYPNSTERNIHGNTFSMHVVEKGNTLIINATTYIYYGAPDTDVQALLKEFSPIIIKFQPGEEKKGICGPAVLVAFALVPLVLFGRRR